MGDLFGGKPREAFLAENVHWAIQEKVNPFAGLTDVSIPLTALCLVKRRMIYNDFIYLIFVFSAGNLGWYM